MPLTMNLPRNFLRLKISVSDKSKVPEMTHFGLWLAGKEHPSFPYGLYKAETLATLFTSVAVIIAGYEIARKALLGPETIPDVAVTFPKEGTASALLKEAGVEVILVEESDVGKKEVCRHEKSKIGGFNR